MSEFIEWKLKDGGWLHVYQLPERASNGSFRRSIHSPLFSASVQRRPSSVERIRS